MCAYFLLRSMDRKSALLLGAAAVDDAAPEEEEDCVCRKTALGTKETWVRLVRFPPPRDTSSLSVKPVLSRRGGGLLSATINTCAGLS